MVFNDNPDVRQRALFTTNIPNHSTYFSIGLFKGPGFVVSRKPREWLENICHRYGRPPNDAFADYGEWICFACSLLVGGCPAGSGHRL